MTRNRKRKLAAVIVGVVLVAVPLVGVYGRAWWVPVAHRLLGSETVETVVEKYGFDARSRLATHFDAAGVTYPPDRALLLAIKDTAQLELWATSDNSEYRLIHVYPILKLSGELGPKLREGDRQMPEGIYAIEGLNPNSSYHLSMKLDYPNAYDRTRAAEDGRTSPGSNIFIHGKALSVGCLAMGDPAIEELFVLAADTALDRMLCIIVPRDPRQTGWDEVTADAPAWTIDLYAKIEKKLTELSVPE